MENDIRWPQKGDNPFTTKKGGYNSPTWCSLNWLSNFNLDDSYYADAYKKAADKIISELERAEKHEHADPMFLPIAFLYRHCLELKMKSVINKGIELEIIEVKKNEVVDVLESHNLHKIWNIFKAMATAHWPGGNVDELNSTENIILNFHKVDQSGQNLRYSKDKHGNKTSKTLPESVELTNLKDTFEGVFNLLDGCDMEFANCIDMRNEMLSEYYN